MIVPGTWDKPLRNLSGSAADSRLCIVLGWSSLDHPLVADLRIKVVFNDLHVFRALNQTYAVRYDNVECEGQTRTAANDFGLHASQRGDPY